MEHILLVIMLVGFYNLLIYKINYLILNAYYVSLIYVSSEYDIYTFCPLTTCIHNFAFAQLEFNVSTIYQPFSIPLKI